MRAQIAQILKLLGGADLKHFLRATAKLVAGAGAARAVAILSAPLLTRLYTPASYGEFATFAAAVMIIMPLVTLRYPVAIPLAKSDAFASAIFGVALLSVVSVVGILGVSIYVALSIEIVAPFLQSLKLHWPLVLVGAVLCGLFEALSMWAIRARAYGVIARAEVAQSVVGEGVKWSAGGLGLGGIGLICGQLANYGLGAALLGWKYGARILRGLRRLRLKELLSAAKRHVGFPQYRMPSQFLLVFSAQSPVLIVASLYGGGIAGQFGLATLIVGVPVSLLANPVSRVFYAEAVKLSASSVELKRMIFAVQNRMLLVSILIVLPLILLGQPLASFVFGAEWRLAGQLAAIMSLPLLAQLPSTPVMQIFNIWGEQALYLKFNAFRVIGTFALFAFAVYADLDIISFVICLSAFLFAVYVAQTIFVLWRVRA